MIHLPYASQNQYFSVSSNFSAHCNAVSSVEVEGIAAQRTSTRVTRLEPLEKTAGVEQVLAGWAALGRKLLVRADDGVADCTFTLTLEGTGDVLAPGREPVSDASVLPHKSAWSSEIMQVSVLTENVMTP